MPKFKSIIFDLDGTLTDPKEGITKSLNFALEKMGLERRSEEDLVKYIGPPLKQIFSELTHSDNEEYLSKCSHTYRERYGTVGLLENNLYEGMSEALKTLKKSGVRLFVATSKATVFARRILEYFEVEDLFERIEGSNLDNTRQNKAEVISYVLETSKLDKTATVMVGDRKHDLIGAAQCGIPAIGVLFGYGSREELDAHSPIYIAKTVKELECYLIQ